jgi:hypothetical protein
MNDGEFKTFPELTVLDRCDRCGGQAIIACIKAENLLIFCGPDFDKNRAALEENGWKFDDQTQKLLDTVYYN